MKAYKVWDSEETGLRYVWHGGHTVNIYQGDTEIDCFSVGDFSRNQATESEVMEGIKEIDNAILNGER